MFTTDDIKDFNDIVTDMVSEIGECTQRTIKRDNTVEISLDRGSRHLGLIEMVACPDYNHQNRYNEARIKSVVIRGYRFIDRHNNYRLVKSKINEKNFE